MIYKQIFIALGYCGAAFSICMVLPSEASTEHLVGALGVMLSVLLVDVLSFSQGLNRGLDIAQGVFTRLCRDKRIKVVPNE